MSELSSEASPPARRGGAAVVRKVGAWAHVLLGAAVVVGVFLQVYLIGAYVFGAGTSALDAHRSAGFTVHMLEVLVFVAALVAWLPRREIGWSAALAVVGTVQLLLADGERWVGALHPLLALFVLALAALLLRGHAQRRRPAAARP